MLSGAGTFQGCTQTGTAQLGTSAVFSGATAPLAAADAPSSTSCSPGAAVMTAAPLSAVQGEENERYRPAERQYSARSANAVGISCKVAVFSASEVRPMSSHSEGFF